MKREEIKIQKIESDLKCFMEQEKDLDESEKVQHLREMFNKLGTKKYKPYLIKKVPKKLVNVLFYSLQFFTVEKVRVDKKNNIYFSIIH